MVLFDFPDTATMVLNNPKMTSPCPEYIRLEEEVQRALHELEELMEALLAAFRAENRELFFRLDKEVERMLARKEMLLGALSQHLKDHRCAPSWVP